MHELRLMFFSAYRPTLSMMEAAFYDHVTTDEDHVTLSLSIHNVAYFLKEAVIKFSAERDLTLMGLI